MMMMMMMMIDAVLSGRSSPKFQKNALPQSSGPKSKPSKVQASSK
jgi:hypothetical protein